MPNTPAMVGQGMTVWTCNEDRLTDKQKAKARLVLSSVGKEIFVKEEAYLDMATAISGTGPAYFFLILETIIDAGVHMGLPRTVAQTLALQTMKVRVGRTKLWHVGLTYAGPCMGPESLLPRMWTRIARS